MWQRPQHFISHFAAPSADSVAISEISTLATCIFLILEVSLNYSMIMVVCTGKLLDDKGGIVIKEMLHHIADRLQTVRKPGAVLSPLSIRRESLPYFAGWIIIFTWLYCYFLPNGNLLFLDGGALTGHERTATYIWLIVCPLITTFSKGVRYVPVTIYSVAAAMLSFVLLTFFEFSMSMVFWLELIIAVAVGHIFASCGYGFFMMLNNAEKFYSMILGIFVPKLLMMIHPLVAGYLKGISFSAFILFCCLLSMLVCSVYFTRERSLVPNVEKNPFPRQGWSLMALVFVILAFNDVIAPLLLFEMKNTLKLPLAFWYFGGIVAGLCLVLLLQKQWKLNLCTMLNLSLALLTIGFVIGVVAEHYIAAALICAVCFGLAYSIGLVNIYYLAGFMAKKFQNITFYRVGIILSAVYYFYGFGSMRLFKHALPILSTLSVCILILFFLLSPLFVRLLYSGEWIDDSYRQDVTFESRLRARLKDLRLSPKETEVCELLLRGYTLRQTAAMLEIAYPTANTYCTALYRKLCINSRTELTLLFKEFIE